MPSSANIRWNPGDWWSIQRIVAPPLWPVFVATVGPSRESSCDKALWKRRWKDPQKWSCHRESVNNKTIVQFNQMFPPGQQKPANKCHKEIGRRATPRRRQKSDSAKTLCAWARASTGAVWSWLSANLSHIVAIFEFAHFWHFRLDMHLEVANHKANISGRSWDKQLVVESFDAAFFRESVLKKSKILFPIKRTHN